MLNHDTFRRFFVSSFLISFSVVGFCGVSAKEKKKVVKVEFDVVYSLSERVVDPFLIEVYNITDSVIKTPDRSLWREGEGRLMLEAGKLYKATVLKSSLDLKTDDGKNYYADPEFEPAFLDIDLRGVTKNVKLDQVRIKKKMQKTLGEVTVNSSRILFYHKGDTLIYNASEFILAEGSMLDALIKQLPGVELKEDGEIFVNGKKVDDLLLNGKNLFNDNRQLMLENLGAYTVKDIAVYEKNTEVDMLLGRDSGRDKRYSMDVRLKRDYSVGWNGNIEAGYGTHDRYMAKLFAIMMADNVYISLRGAINNLSSGFSTEDWSPEKMQTGLKTTKSAGFSYGVDGHAGKWKIDGNTNLTHITDDSRITTVSENFLPGKSNYQYSFDNSISKQLDIATDHFFRLAFPKKAVFSLHPYFEYHKRKVDGTSVSALFNDNVHNITADRLRDIYRGYNSLADTLVYRNISQNLVDGYSTKSRVDFEADLNVGSNKLNFIFLGTYDSRKENIEQLYLINHGANSNPSTREYQNRDLSPDNTLKLKGYANYYIDTDWHQSRIILSYNYEHIRTINTSNVSSAVDWDVSADASAMTIAQVQALPGFAPLLSPDLSYNSRLNTDIHGINASFSHVVPIKVSDNISLNVHASPLNLKFSRRNYLYNHADMPVTLKRSSVLPGAYGGIMFESKNGASGGLFYNMSSEDAPMQSMVTLPSVDPLNIYIGNPDLKKYITHNLNLGLRFSKGQRYHMVETGVGLFQNAITQGYVFNTATGVRYYHPFNVNGNRSIMAKYEFFTPFGAGNRFDITTTTTGNHNNSVDLIGATTETDGFSFNSDEQKRRYIKTLSLTENVRLKYKIGERSSVSAIGEVRLNDYRSHDQGFQNFTSWTARYGASGVIALPEGFGLSTDLTVYTRRGFTDARLNTSDVVWNARLTKSIMKGNMTFAVDAYDMLRQLSNITYTVNAQARTEVVTNVVPAYVLFHVMYRFNHQPKRH